VILSLLKTNHTLTGKTIAVLAESTAKPRVKALVDPALAAMGVQQVRREPDDQRHRHHRGPEQLDSLSNAWKTRASTRSCSSATPSRRAVSSRKLRKKDPGVLLVSDTTSVLDACGRRARRRL